jgi:hypothetical protein
MVTVNEKPDEKKSEIEIDKQKRDNVRDVLQVSGKLR